MCDCTNLDRAALTAAMERVDDEVEGNLVFRFGLFRLCGRRRLRCAAKRSGRSGTRFGKRNSRARGERRGFGQRLVRSVLARNASLRRHGVEHVFGVWAVAEGGRRRGPVRRAVHPGATSCSGTTLRTCSSTGIWQNSGVVAGRCGAQCTPGATSCSGITFRTCNTSGVWQSVGVVPGRCGA